MSAMAVDGAPASNSSSGGAAVLPADNDGDYYQVNIPATVRLLVLLVRLVAPRLIFCYGESLLNQKKGMRR